MTRPEFEPSRPRSHRTDPGHTPGTMEWRIREAKVRFSEMVERMKEGLQTLTRHGKPVAVVVSVDEYGRLYTAGKSFRAPLAPAPLEDLRIKRPCDTGRIIDVESS